MKYILSFIYLFCITLCNAQPGDPENLRLAENRRKLELLKKLEQYPHNPSLLYEKVYQDLRTLNIEIYRSVNNGQETIVSTEMNETAAQLDELIALQPNNAQLYFMRGNFHFFYTNANKTVDDFERALQLSTDNSFRINVFHKLSLCHYHIGIDNEQYNMDKSLAYIDSANLASEDGKEPFARDKIYFLQLAKKEAELHSYYKTLAIFNLEACRDDNNIKLYRFDDNFLQALSYLYEAAIYYSRNKNFETAIKILKICIDAAPKNKAGQAMPNNVILQCKHLLSKIYREPAIDDYDKALEYIIQAVDEPQSWLLDEHELLKDLDFFLQKSSDNPDLLIAMAIYYFKIAWQGNGTREDILSEQMDPLLEKALNRGSQSYKIPLMLSIRNRVYKHLDQAFMYAKEAVEKSPENYYCQSELFQVLRNFPETEEKVFQEIKKKIDGLFYDSKPDFGHLIKTINTL
jgi:hypothetical protein